MPRKRGRTHRVAHRVYFLLTPRPTEKISHIKSLGADVIWLSPIFHMRKEKFEGHGAFHGYWVQDLNQIERAFGGEKALIELSSTAKENNICRNAISTLEQKLYIELEKCMKKIYD